MATSFDDINNKFITLIKEKELINDLTESELDELLDGYINFSSALYFKECKKDLTDIDSVSRQFNQDLDDEEQWIVAYGMTLNWISNKVLDETKLRGRFISKDYQSFSPANLIKVLDDIKTNLKAEMLSFKNSYNYNNFTGY